MIKKPMWKQALGSSPVPMQESPFVLFLCAEERCVSCEFVCLFACLRVLFCFCVIFNEYVYETCYTQTNLGQGCRPHSIVPPRTPSQPAVDTERMLGRPYCF